MHVTLVHAYVEASAIDDFIEACRLNQGSAAESGNRRSMSRRTQPIRAISCSMKPTPARADARAHKETAHYLRGATRWRA